MHLGRRERWIRVAADAEGGDKPGPRGGNATSISAGVARGRVSAGSRPDLAVPSR